MKLSSFSPINPSSESDDDVETTDDFFYEIDNNRNDNITLDEISTFVRHQNLDLESEESAVENIFRSLDSNGDKILHREDFKELWASIGSALSVEEVAEWAEHAQQLPEEISREFSYHRITGYDFPELVEDDGILLERELGIARQGLKKRVLKSMKLILLGANQKPISPSHVTATPITCSRVKVDWEMNTSDKLTFPVHKFVVQRAVKHAYIFPLAPWNSPLPQHQWVTVCEGLETECEDWVPAGYAAANSSHRILYRVTGWNALGRSERVVVSVNTNLEGHEVPCPLVDRVFSASNAVINIVRTPSLLSLAMLVISLTFVAVAGMYILLSASSFRRRRRSESVSHGSNRNGGTPNAPSLQRPPLPAQRRTRPLPTHCGRCLSDELLASAVSLSRLDRSRTRTPSPTNYNSNSNDGTTTMSPSAALDQTDPTSESEEMSLKPPLKSVSPKTDLRRRVIFKESTSTNTTSTNTNTSTTPPTSERSSSWPEHGREDEFARCSVCEKPYKMLKWKWRRRHHCSACSSSFCSNCGFVDHIELMPCKVPGTCVCSRCDVNKTRKPSQKAALAMSSAATDVDSKEVEG